MIVGYLSRKKVKGGGIYVGVVAVRR